MASNLRLKGISFVYPRCVAALDCVDLRVAAGELMTVVGPSGSGKTTLLKIAAGLERPSAGRVLLDGEDVTDSLPRDRDVAMVFQGAILYPHLSVAGNLAFGLKVRGVPRKERSERTWEMAARLGLERMLDRKPDTLSGGQARRVALGRALVRRPRLFLLDEPLAGLDLPLRRELRAEIRRLHEEIGVTTVLVTHDQEEAIALGDRVAVLNSGKIRQVATAEKIYANPADTFVAKFIGLLPTTFLRAELRRDSDSARIETAGVSLPAPRRWLEALGEDASSRILLGIRPENVTVTSLDEAEASESDLRGRIVRVESIGGWRVVHLVLGSSERLLANIGRDAAPPTADEVAVRLDLEGAHAFAADGGGRNLTLTGA